MRGSIRYLLLSLVFAVGACGFDAPPPKRTPPPVAPPLPLSTLAATLTLPVSTLIATLNDKTQTEIANIRDEPVDCAIAKCSLDLVATRTGPITGHAADGRLSLDVPVSATAQMELKTPLFKTKAHSLATGAIHANTALQLEPDWHLQTDTKGSVDLSQAELKMGPIKMSFAELWNRNQERLSQPLFKAIDRHVASGVKLKPQAERLWEKVQRPIRVGKAPTAWLVLDPERIRVTPLVTRDNVMTVSMGVDVRAHVVVSEQPPTSGPDRPLPAPANFGGPSDRFDFAVPVLLPYGEASALAMQRLSKSPVKVGTSKLRFEKLEILPSGQDVVIAATFCVSQGWDPFGWFDSCGEGYLRGTPQFDAHTATIRIVNVHYDIATEGMIMAAMRYLAGDQLGKALETKLVFNVGRDIDKLDTELKTALAKPQGRGVTVSGDIQSFGTPTLTWTADGFLATFPATGTLHANLNLKSGGPLDIR
jgi:hypothetical protein